MTAFPNITLPLRIRPLEALEDSFVIEDTAGQLVLAVYFDEGDEVRRQVRKRMTRADAEAAAIAAARGITAMVEGKG